MADAMKAESRELAVSRENDEEEEEEENWLSTGRDNELMPRFDLR